MKKQENPKTELVCEGCGQFESECNCPPITVRTRSGRTLEIHCDYVHLPLTESGRLKLERTKTLKEVGELLGSHFAGQSTSNFINWIISIVPKLKQGELEEK